MMVGSLPPSFKGGLRNPPLKVLSHFSPLMSHFAFTVLFNAKPMTGLTRKEKKAATKTMTPRQKRAQSKLREEIV